MPIRKSARQPQTSACSLFILKSYDPSGFSSIDIDFFVSQCSISMHEPYLRLIERLLPVMPHPSLDSFFFLNSGSEAVEASIKMARALTNRQNIISMQGVP